MKSKSSRVFAGGLLLAGLMCLSACGGNDGSQTSGKPGPDPISEESGPKGEIIKSLKANKSVVDLKVKDEELMVSAYYTIAGIQKLTAAQKKVTVTSSAPEVVEIIGGATASTSATLKAKTQGEATITVTSAVESQFTCSWKINVTEAYFDLDMSTYQVDDDFSNENNPDKNGREVITSGLTDFFFTKHINSTRFYIESTIAFESVSVGELYPKAGIVVSTGKVGEVSSNALLYGLNAYIGDLGNQNWTDLHCCECFGATWAWNMKDTEYTDRPGQVRFCDSIAQSDKVITYNTSYTIGLVRWDNDFHLFFNGFYKGTIHDTSGLFFDEGYVNTRVGFFEWNSTVHFSRYDATQDEATVQAMLPTEVTDLDSLMK